MITNINNVTNINNGNKQQQWQQQTTPSHVTLSSRLNNIKQHLHQDDDTNLSLYGQPQYERWYTFFFPWNETLLIYNPKNRRTPEPKNPENIKTNNEQPGTITFMNSFASLHELCMVFVHTLVISFHWLKSVRYILA